MSATIGANTPVVAPKSARDNTRPERDHTCRRNTGTKTVAAEMLDRVGTPEERDHAGQSAEECEVLGAGDLIQVCQVDEDERPHETVDHDLVVRNAACSDFNFYRHLEHPHQFEQPDCKDACNSRCRGGCNDCSWEPLELGVVRPFDPYR